MFRAGNPYLLAIDHVVVALLNRQGFQLSGVGAGVWFTDTKRLQPQRAVWRSSVDSAAYALPSRAATACP